MKPKSLNRRTFIADSAKSSLALTIGAISITSFLESCNSSKNVASGKGFSTGFDQTPLPYSYDALENVVDKQTMEIHYSKHAAAYSKALKEAALAEGVATGTNVEKLLANISKYSTKMRNNAGGHYNHEVFWKSMRPATNDNKPQGALLEAIEKKFTSFGNFKMKFGEAAKTRFGSGWAWLYIDANKNLQIGSTPNQDNPLMNVSEIQGLPLLGLDVWEHAYYLKYQNKRADYIDQWWKVVNWDYVQDRYNKFI